MTTHRPKVVILGMLTKIPVGGVAWLVGQYLVGLERLGFEPYYVEAHARTPSMLMEHPDDDASRRAAEYISKIMARFGMPNQWAFHALHDNGHCYGLSHSALQTLYREAVLIVNLHGGTVPLPEHSATGRLIYMGSDPGDLELELHRGERHAIDFLEPHVAFFTWGLNYGNNDCLLPYSDRFHFVHSPPPVVADLWGPPSSEPRTVFTTIGNWRQSYRDVKLDGEVYTWSKHHEFMKVIDLPTRSGATFELALSSYREEDERLLTSHGWSVQSGLEISREVDSYRAFIQNSMAEFTVAKDQNVRLRTGWFSERSASYLAAGRPVVTQDTGFASYLPTGEGLFPFLSADDAVEAVRRVALDYPLHSKVARDLAVEYFNYDRVLPALLRHVGVDATKKGGRSREQTGGPL